MEFRFGIVGMGKQAGVPELLHHKGSWILLNELFV